MSNSNNAITVNDGVPPKRQDDPSLCHVDDARWQTVPAHRDRRRHRWMVHAAARAFGYLDANHQWFTVEQLASVLGRDPVFRELFGSESAALAVARHLSLKYRRNIGKLDLRFEHKPPRLSTTGSHEYRVAN